MKNRLRLLGWFFLLFALLTAGCGEESPETAAAPGPGTTIGSDPAAELLEILEIDDRFERTEELIAKLRAMPARRIEAIPAVLKQMSKKRREVERLLLVSGWSRVDPEAATKWAMANERQDYLRKPMFAESVYAWALEDPEGLRSDFKVGMYSLRGWDGTMLRAFIRGWYDSGEPDLEMFIRDLGRTGDDQQRAISELISAKLEREEPEAMIAWVTALEGGTRYRAYAYSRLAADIAETNPQLAITWCEEVCDTEVGKDMPHWIATSWVRESGADALDWVMARPETAAVRIGIRAGYRRFLKVSPDEAEAWLEKFSEEDRAGPLLQGPVIMYVNRKSNLAKDDVAIEWTKFIENDWERERSLSTIAGRWLRRDEDAAKLWLAGNEELAEGAKADLLRVHERYKEKAARMRKERESRPAWVDAELAK